ncbi:ComF family protein [Sedimentitalea todarodis]|uniref:ComF family protein n=1 Tax=Sedimentitalea todarodis TaxID=1631240 RepID=A0ABU3VDM0_9RHOB|nr:ComF family protein [Sedimentitalea todarodis]MDU9004266.1 ComF family protein [Sedimentitalea todarodis]
MLARIQTAVSLLYPPRCLGCGDMVESDFGLCGTCWRETAFVGGTVCESCGVPLPGTGDGHRLECDDCMAHPHPWSHGRATLVYEGRARQMVLALKHGDRPEIARPAGRWMAHAARSILVPETVVVPVPLHWSRFLKRRYNQSALLAQSLAQELRIDVCPDLLRRTKRTAMLEGKTPEQRFATLEGAIQVNPDRKEKLQGRTALLIDDVMTTGATLSACTLACRANGAKDVRVLTLARVAKDA